MGMMMRVHALDPGNVQDHGGLLNLPGQLQHGVQRAAAGEGDVLDGAHDDQQGVGVEQIDVLVGEQDKKGHTHSNRGHQIGQKCH